MPTLPKLPIDISLNPNLSLLYILYLYLPTYVFQRDFLLFLDYTPAASS